MGYATSGQLLAQAETSIGTTLQTAVADYYSGLDLETAQAIRRADSDTEAARLVTAIRQGRATEVLSVAVLAALGAVAGAVSQKAGNNFTVGGIPAVSPLGMVPTVVGLAAPLSLSARSVLAAGGMSYMVGAAIYQMATQPEVVA